MHARSITQPAHVHARMMQQQASVWSMCGCGHHFSCGRGVAVSRRYLLDFKTRALRTRVAAYVCAVYVALLILYSYIYNIYIYIYNKL